MELVILYFGNMPTEYLLNIVYICDNRSGKNNEFSKS